MSFILDALRKSENERQKSSVPGVAAEGRVSSEQRVPMWAIATIGTLAVALLAIAGGWWWSGRAQSEVTQFVGVTKPEEQTPQVRSLAQEARRTRPQPTATEPRNVPPATTPQPPPADPPPTNNASVQANPPPTLATVVAGGLNLPHLNLDIHVYAPEVTDRFVFVNARKYRQGDTLREGPEIVEIADNGVLLSYQGERFLLPRD